MRSRSDDINWARGQLVDILSALSPAEVDANTKVLCVTILFAADRIVDAIEAATKDQS